MGRFSDKTHGTFKGAVCIVPLKVQWVLFKTLPTVKDQQTIDRNGIWPPSWQSCQHEDIITSQQPFKHEDIITSQQLCKHEELVHQFNIACCSGTTCSFLLSFHGNLAQILPNQLSHSGPDQITQPQISPIIIQANVQLPSHCGCLMALFSFCLRFTINYTFIAGLQGLMELLFYPILGGL